MSPKLSLVAIFSHIQQFFENNCENAKQFRDLYKIVLSFNRTLIRISYWFQQIMCLKLRQSFKYLGLIFASKIIRFYFRNGIFCYTHDLINSIKCHCKNRLQEYIYNFLRYLMRHAVCSPISKISGDRRN